MGCHGVMDPLGFALENFDTVGQYHVQDAQTLTKIDTSGVLPDGTPISGPDDLRRRWRAARSVRSGAHREFVDLALGRSIDYLDAGRAKNRTRCAGGRLPLRVDRPRYNFKRCFP
jgi:hypothetical protein